jgi:hypothetical protein
MVVKGTLMLKPEGYTRSINDSSGAISLLDELTLDLSGVTAINADNQELCSINCRSRGICSNEIFTFI